MKKIFMFCLMLCLVAPIAIRAEKKPFGNGLYWELNDDGVLRISGNGYMSRLEIESIRPWKLSRKEIKKIILGEGVCSIGFGAFYDSSVESVELPNTIEWIGDNAFGLCNMLKTINLPSSLKSIGNSAFRGCTKLTSVIIPNTVISIGHGAFSSCSNLSSITLSTSLTSIEDGTFANSGLSSIYLPNSITSIGELAFYGCHYLSSVFLSNSLKTIASKAFADCNRLNQIAIPSSVNAIETNAFDKGTVLVKDQEACLLLDAKQGRFLWEAKQGKYKKLSDDAPVACYIVEEGLYRGVLSVDGNWIIPLNKNNLTILYAGGSYIKVRKTDGYGIISFEGQEIIPSNRKYTSISDFNEINKTFAFTKIGVSGICNARGEVITTKRVPLTDYEVKQKGGYVSAVEMKNGNTKYYKVSKGGRYGLTDSEGKEIVPCEMEALESAGTGYLKYKINGFWGVMNYIGKIIIGTERGYTSIGDFVTFSKRFPYTMAGYKGECDATGRQVSKIKVDTPKQAVAKQEPNTSQKQVSQVPCDFDYHTENINGENHQYCQTKGYQLPVLNMSKLDFSKIPYAAIKYALQKEKHKGDDVYLFVIQILAAELGDFYFEPKEIDGVITFWDKTKTKVHMRLFLVEDKIENKYFSAPTFQFVIGYEKDLSKWENADIAKIEWNGKSVEISADIFTAKTIKAMHDTLRNK